MRIDVSNKSLTASLQILRYAVIFPVETRYIGSYQLAGQYIPVIKAFIVGRIRISRMDRSDLDSGETRTSLAGCHCGAVTGNHQILNTLADRCLRVVHEDRAVQQQRCE